VEVGEGGTLPAELWRCKQLKVLKIKPGPGGVCLTTLPSQVGELTSLTTLIVSGNALTSLPAEIGDLDDLRVIEAESNKIQSLPESLDLGSLEVDLVSSNPFCRIRDCISSCWDAIHILWFLLHLTSGP